MLFGSIAVAGERHPSVAARPNEYPTFDGRVTRGQIFRNREVRKHVQLLGDHANAECLRLAGVGNSEWGSTQSNFSLGMGVGIETLR